MHYFLRRFLFILLAGPLSARAADQPPKAIAIPLAAPAFVDVVTFTLHQEGESHKMVVTTSPTLLRVDEPDDGYSVIYNAQTDSYIGLEHRNYTYWTFSWPEVRQAVQASKRYEHRLDELNLAGVNTESSTSTNAPAGATSVPGDSGYVWRPTNDHKTIAGLACVRWTGDSVSSDGVETWCFAGPLPKVQAAMERLRVINEPMALVPVRTLVPSQVFIAFDALVRGGVTPVLISWGGDRDKNTFAFVDARSRDGKLSLFTVPSLYIKTTLVTMDGLIDQPK